MLSIRRSRLDGGADLRNEKRPLQQKNATNDGPCVDDTDYSKQTTSRISNSSSPIKDGFFKLLISAVGIYSSYLVYGSLQEDVFTYKSSIMPSSPAFRNIWFVQLLESCTNAVCAYVGVMVSKRSESTEKNLNQMLFFSSGISQVCSKALTSLSLANGLSFPVATMAKSGKMAPVMIGQFFLGGSTFCGREYAQVIAIIIGTSMLGMSKEHNVNLDDKSSNIGVLFILSSLIMDGITAGIQKRIKMDAAVNGIAVKGKSGIVSGIFFFQCTNH